MKKILLISALMTIFTTGCVSPDKTYYADTPINGESLTINFAANDEDKIEIKTSFPKSEQHVIADKKLTTTYLDQRGLGCLCIGRESCNIGGTYCAKRTVPEYSNIACLTESSFQNNFDNSEQKFYARAFSRHYVNDSAFDPYPICANNRNYDTNEIFSAYFKKTTNKNILSFIITPSKKTIDTRWYKFYRFDDLFTESKDPTNEKELAADNYTFNYAYRHPVDLKSLLSSAVTINYTPKINDFKTKYDPTSTINSLKKQIKGKYQLNINTESNDCYNIILNRDEVQYSYTVAVNLCRVNNTQSEASIGNAKITIKTTGTVDLTKFGSVIKEITGYLK